MKQFLFIIFIIWSGFAFSQSTAKLVFKVDFQESFVNDTITLEINDQIIVSQKVVNSDEVTGISNLSLSFTQGKNKSYLICSLDSIKVKQPKRNLKIKIRLNHNSVFLFCIDLKHGQYIGFYKGQKNEISLVQAKQSFQYD